MLYILAILEKCTPDNKQIKSISELKPCFSNFNNTQVMPIIDELIKLEQNINKPIEDYDKDYEQYSTHYDTIIELIRNMEDMEDMRNTQNV
jgi:hypothetical protein